MRAIVIVLSIFLVLNSCKKKESAKTIKLAHSLSVSHPIHASIVYMAEKVEENSSGKLKIKIYPGSQLGSERESLELLQIGSLGMTKVSAAVMENFSPDLKVLSYPYVFRDREHRYKFFDSEVGERLLLGGEKFWLRGLTYFDAGSRSFYTKEKMVKTPEDLKGMKIRVMQSPTAINLIESLGGAPTPISWGELYTSLQQGVVDGAENNLPSFHTSKHYEVCKYFSVNEHSAMPDILVMGTLVWNSLNEEEKKWLSEAVEDTAIKQRALWQEAENLALEEIKLAGVEVFYPEKASFEKQSVGMVESLKDENERLFNVINEIKSIK